MSVPLFSALFRMFKILHNKSLFKLNCKKQERAVHQEEVTLETKPELAWRSGRWGQAPKTTRQKRKAQRGGRAPSRVAYP